MNAALLRPDLVIGLGSHRGDDRLGWIAAERLRQAGFTTVCARTGAELLSLFEGREWVVVVDASEPGSNPGRIRRFEWPDDIFWEAPSRGTHGLGLLAALRLADALDDSPPRVSIYTIEAKTVGELDPLSPEVERALAELVALMVDQAGPILQSTLADQC